MTEHRCRCISGNHGEHPQVAPDHEGTELLRTALSRYLRRMADEVERGPVTSSYFEVGVADEALGTMTGSTRRDDVPWRYTVDVVIGPRS